MTGQTEKKTISLPKKQADFADKLVAEGEFASVSEVMRAGLRALQEKDEVYRRWLMQEVAPVYDAVEEGRMKTYPLDEVMEELRQRNAKLGKKSA